MGLSRILAMKFSRFIDKFLRKPFKDPIKTQEKLFFELIHRNQDTIFGKRHKFAQIHSIQQFQQNCPIYEYTAYKPYIQLILEGRPNVLTKAKQVYWGQTPGTTGPPKMIPIVNHTFRSVNLSVICIMISYIMENPSKNSSFLDGISCFLAAYPLLRYEGKLPVGHGTGLFSYYRGGTQIWKFFTKSRLYIPIHLYKIRNIEQRYYQLTKELIGKDIRLFSGVPSILVNALDKIVENASKLGVNINKIHEIFPNYHFNFFGGVSPRFYEKKLETLIGRKIDWREHYSATEGVLGIQLQETPGFTPMINANFFEFVPVRNPDNRYVINEIKKKEEYYICISAFNGLYAYKLGDVIKFISVDPPLFIFLSRDGVVNLVDEKLSHENILYAISQANQKFNAVVTDFSVIGLRTPSNHYLFIAEFSSDSHPASYSEYLIALDQFLQSTNVNYKFFRTESAILKAPRMWVLHNGSFSELLSRENGYSISLEQRKIPHLTDDLSVRKLFEDKVKREISI
ncbi:MAG: GH3 family domain-containing protein [Candidatus Helarchaeota archaeon]